MKLMLVRSGFVFVIYPAYNVIIAVFCMGGSTERGIELGGVLKRMETDSGL